MHHIVPASLCHVLVYNKGQYHVLVLFAEEKSNKLTSIYNSVEPISTTTTSYLYRKLTTVSQPHIYAAGMDTDTTRSQQYCVYHPKKLGAAPATARPGYRIIDMSHLPIDRPCSVVCFLLHPSNLTLLHVTYVAL